MNSRCKTKRFSKDNIFWERKWFQILKLQVFFLNWQDNFKGKHSSKVKPWANVINWRHVLRNIQKLQRAFVGKKKEKRDEYWNSKLIHKLGSLHEIIHGRKIMYIFACARLYNGQDCVYVRSQVTMAHLHGICLMLDPYIGIAARKTCTQRNSVCPENEVFNTSSDVVIERALPATWFNC